MTPLIQRKWFAAVATGGALSFILLALHFRDEPRMIDGQVTILETVWWEAIVLFFSVFGVFLGWLSAIKHSFKKREIPWFWWTLFCWPVALVYAWKIHGSLYGQPNENT